jgi:hypothetical protein
MQTSTKQTQDHDLHLSLEYEMNVASALTISVSSVVHSRREAHSHELVFRWLWLRELSFSWSDGEYLDSSYFTYGSVLKWISARAWSTNSGGLRGFVENSAGYSGARLRVALSFGWLATNALFQRLLARKHRLLFLSPNYKTIRRKRTAALWINCAVRFSLMARKSGNLPCGDKII